MGKCVNCAASVAANTVLCRNCLTTRLAKVTTQSDRLNGNACLLADAVDSVTELQGGYPDNNPKAAIGAKKCPLHLVPPALSIGVAEALQDGATKYGAFNFRDSNIAANVYTGAILRHLYAYMDGEDLAEDSGIHHLKHVGACIALMLDSMACDTFVDDRPTNGKASKLLSDYVAP